MLQICRIGHTVNILQGQRPEGETNADYFVLQASGGVGGGGQLVQGLEQAFLEVQQGRYLVYFHTVVAGDADVRLHDLGYTKNVV